jgi:acetyltransferase-like isoleucine patch superfamily enzyme
MFKPYNNYDKSSFVFFSRIRKKICLSLAKSFPLNSVRVCALRWCGYVVGKNVYIGPDLIVVNDSQEHKGMLVIGDRVAIAPRVTLVLGSDANWSGLNEIIPPERGPIVIGKDSWIGTGVIVLPGVEIGEFSIIGAAALVNKNVPSREVHAGVPAKLIRTI